MDRQPIDTAPRNEDTYILVATGDPAKPCDVVRYGWSKADGGKAAWFNDDVQVDATHWMPLPPPPTGA